MHSAFMATASFTCMELRSVVLQSGTNMYTHFLQSRHVAPLQHAPCCIYADAGETPMEFVAAKTNKYSRPCMMPAACCLLLFSSFLLLSLFSLLLSFSPALVLTILAIIPPTVLLYFSPSLLPRISPSIHVLLLSFALFL